MVTYLAQYDRDRTGGSSYLDTMPQPNIDRVPIIDYVETEVLVRKSTASDLHGALLRLTQWYSHIIRIPGAESQLS